MNSSDNNLITPIIKGKKVIYHLVTEDDLTNLKTDNLFQDILMIVFSILLSLAIAEGNIYYFIISLIFLFIVILFYYKKISFIKRALQSAEIDMYKNPETTEEPVATKFTIKKALYFSDTASKDITNEIIKLVQNNKLFFNGKYNTIAGDTHVGKHKKLKIKYLDNQIEFNKTFNEDEPINLP